MTKKNSEKTVSFGPEQLDLALKQVESLAVPFAGVQPATPAERKRLPKARPSVLSAVPKLARISAKVGLVLPAVSMTDAVAQAEYADRVRQLWTSVAVLHQTLTDELLRVEGSTATSASAMYGMLVRASKKNTSLDTELEPIKAFFRIRPRGTSAGSATEDKAASTKTTAAATDATAETAATTSQAANATSATHP